MKIPFEVESEMLDTLASLIRGQQTYFVALTLSEKIQVRSAYEKLIGVITE